MKTIYANERNGKYTSVEIAEESGVASMECGRGVTSRQAIKALNETTGAKWREYRDDGEYILFVREGEQQ